MNSYFDGHLGKQTLKTLRKYASKIHQIDVITGLKETHGSVLLKSVRMAETFKSKHIKLGDVVAVCGQNHFDLALPFIASLYIGAISINLAPGATLSEVKYTFSIIRPKLIFADPDKLPIFDKAIRELDIKAEIVSFSSNVKKYTPFNDFIRPTGNETNFECEEFDPATTTAFVICTSGSTGLPKLVEKVHQNFPSEFIIPFFRNKTIHLTENEVIFNTSTMFWVSGITNVLSSCLIGNCRINSSLPITADILKKGIENHQPNYMICSPSTVTVLLNHSQTEGIDFSSLKTVICGGGTLAYNIGKKFRERLTNGTLIIGYGSTEMGVVSVNYNIDKFSVGKIFPGIDWKIINPDTGDRLEVNNSGELCINLKNKHTKYYNDPDATTNSIDEEGYFKTGDIVHWQEDNEIKFIDRRKEMIKYKNFQIAPVEIENVIINHLPEIVFVGVVGLPLEGEEVPLAIVQKKIGSNITAKQIEDVVKDNLSDPKALRGGVVFVEKFPLTPAGKLDRKAIRHMAKTISGQEK